MHSHHEKAEAQACSVCHFEPFVRNNYFDGKFMVARDFIDETRFHAEKLRHHQVRLHGWGVVCGLLISEHSSEQCMDRFVRIHSGAAIDCCGREILVSEEEPFDLKSQLKGLYENDQKDPQLHTLQVCIRYRECGTEEVPVLYDECGCDDTKCAHNRILESYQVDVLVDPPLHSEPHHKPNDDWGYFLKSGAGWRMALRQEAHSRYVIDGRDPNKLLQLDPDQRRIVAVHSLPDGAKAIAVAESNDGARVYVAADTGNGADRQLLVLKTADLSVHSEARLFNSANCEVSLAVLPAPKGQLLALVGGEELRIWDTTLDSSSTQPNPIDILNLGSNLKGLAVSADGAHAYSLDIGNQLVVADISGGSLVVAAESPISLPSLSHEPIGVAVDSNGSWLFVLEQEGNATFIETVHLKRLPANQRPATVAARRIAEINPTALALNRRGGIALLKIEEGMCEDLIWNRQKYCPGCDIPNCVVLATIERYQLDAKIRDGDSVADPLDDIQNKIARINNHQGRRILARTEVLQELIKCLIDRGGGGGAGPVGPQGPKGDPGPGIDNVKVSIIECKQAPEPPKLETKQDKRTLILQVPRGCDGQIIPLDLPRIIAINWPHDGEIEIGTDIFNRLNAQGLVVGFNKPVLAETLGRQSFQLLMRHPTALQSSFKEIYCYCNIGGEVSGIKGAESLQCGQIPEFRGSDLFKGATRAARFKPTFNSPNTRKWEPGEYRVVIEGDFILGSEKIKIPNPNNPKEQIEVHPTLDANHLGPGLLWAGVVGRANLPGRCPTGNGTEGGRFVSWFRIKGKKG